MKRGHKGSINPAVLNLISPSGIRFHHNQVKISDQYARIYGAQKYPPMVSTGWLTAICNLPGAITSIGYEPVDPSTMIDAISKNISVNRGLANSTREPLTRQRAMRDVEDGERMLAQIDQQGETVGKMTLFVMPHSDDGASYALMCRQAERTLKTSQIRARIAAFQQEDALKAISPYHVSSERLQLHYERMMPLSTLMGGFPFSTPGYNDSGTGYYVAQDTAGGLIVLDLWKRGGDRTNSNMVFTGISGQGKSTAIKSLMISEYMRGTTVIAIDVENEYVDLCRELDGDFINTGGGAGGRINPLQIRVAPRSDADDIDTQTGNVAGMGNLAMHLKTLEIFFSLYLPGMEDREKVALKVVLEELYRAFKITWDTDTSKFREDQFPTFSHLYTLLEWMIEHGKGGDETDAYRTLHFMLRDIAKGADQFLWNGQTTVRAESNFIVLSTHDLQNTSEAIKRTQYFNVLSWCWQRMSRDRRERVLLVADEAYIMVDPNVPQSLEFLRNVSKRARKYEAAIALITQSVVDFLDPSVRMYGQSLLDMPCYKFLFGCDGQSLHDLQILYNLSEAEHDLLLSKKQGHALLMVGARRLQAIFKIPAYKLACMGSGGGR